MRASNIQYQQIVSHCFGNIHNPELRKVDLEPSSKRGCSDRQKVEIVLRQSLLGKPKQRRQLSKDSAQYPLAPTSTAQKDTFQQVRDSSPF